MFKKLAVDTGCHHQRITTFHLDLSSRQSIYSFAKAVRLELFFSCQNLASRQSIHSFETAVRLELYFQLPGYCIQTVNTRICNSCHVTSCKFVSYYIKLVLIKFFFLDIILYELNNRKRNISLKSKLITLIVGN